MDGMNDNFDVSQLRWWRCIAVDPNDKIQIFITEIGSDNVYVEFNKIRRALRSKGLRFVEAKPISNEEMLAAKKIQQFKRYKKERLQGLTGRHYSPISHLPFVLFFAILFLLILWLVCHH